MQISVLGSDCRAIATAAGLAEMGHEVCCMDDDASLMGLLNRGELPWEEPRLLDQVERGLARQHLWFTSDFSSAIAYGDVLFLIPYTTTAGELDMAMLQQRVAQIALRMQRPTLVVLQGVVPVGTCDEIQALFDELLGVRQGVVQCQVVVQAGVLNRGSLVADFGDASRYFFGSQQHARQGLLQHRLQELFYPFMARGQHLTWCGTREAEFQALAQQTLQQAQGMVQEALVDQARMMGLDVSAMEFSHSLAQFETTALRFLSRSDHAPSLWRALAQENTRQQQSTFRSLHSLYGDELAGKCVALWGLTNEAGTDAIEHSRASYLMESLWEAGVLVQAYDPLARKSCEKLYGDHPALKLVDEASAALDGADVLAVCSDWQGFWAPDFRVLRERLRDRLLLDPLRLYRKEMVEAQGLRYQCSSAGFATDAVGCSTTAFGRAAE